MKTRPNPIVLVGLIIPMSLIVGAIVRVNELDLASALIAGSIGALFTICVEQVLRRAFGLGLPADRQGKPELWPLPDFLTLILLLVSIGPAIGVSSAMISRFYGVHSDSQWPIQFAIVAAVWAFMAGMVRLIRHIVRLEFAKVGPDQSSDAAAGAADLRQS